MADDDDFGELYGDAGDQQAPTPSARPSDLAAGSNASHLAGDDDLGDIYGDGGQHNQQQVAGNPAPGQGQPSQGLPLPVMDSMPRNSSPPDASDDEDDDFDIRLDAPDPEAYQVTAPEEKPRRAEGQDDDDDDDFNVFLDDPSQSVMGGPESSSAQQSKQYVRPGVSFARTTSLPKPGLDGLPQPYDVVPGAEGISPPGAPPGGPAQPRPPVGGPPLQHPFGAGRPGPPPGAPPPGTPAGQMSQGLSAPTLAAIRATPKEHAMFPNAAGPTDPIKLPGQTRVSPEEYKEFLSMGHGDIFSLDLDRVVEECAPWRVPGARASDFFNYDMNLKTWKEYCGKIHQYRLEYTMQKKIPTFDSAVSVSQHDLPMAGGWGRGYHGGPPQGPPSHMRSGGPGGFFPPRPPDHPPPQHSNNASDSFAISLTGAGGPPPEDSSKGEVRVLKDDAEGGGEGRVLAGGKDSAGHGGGRGGGGGGRGGGRGGGGPEGMGGMNPMGNDFMKQMMAGMNPMMAGMMQFMPGMPQMMGMMGPGGMPFMPGMPGIPGMDMPRPPPPPPPKRKSDVAEPKEEEKPERDDTGPVVKADPESEHGKDHVSWPADGSVKHEQHEQHDAGSAWASETAREAQAPRERRDDYRSRQQDTEGNEFSKRDSRDDRYNRGGSARYPDDRRVDDRKPAGDGQRHDDRHAPYQGGRDHREDIRSDTKKADRSRDGSGKRVERDSQEHATRRDIDRAPVHDQAANRTSRDRERPQGRSYDDIPRDARQGDREQDRVPRERASGRGWQRDREGDRDRTSNRDQHAFRERSANRDQRHGRDDAPRSEATRDRPRHDDGYRRDRVLDQPRADGGRERPRAAEGYNRRPDDVRDRVKSDDRPRYDDGRGSGGRDRALPENGRGDYERARDDRGRDQSYKRAREWDDYDRGDRRQVRR